MASIIYENEELADDDQFFGAYGIPLGSTLFLNERRLGERMRRRAPVVAMIPMPTKLSFSAQALPGKSHQANQENGSKQRSVHGEQIVFKDNVPLNFGTPAGERTVYAKRGAPLGMSFVQNEVPLSVTTLSQDSQARQLGIEFGWILKGVDGIDVSELTDFRNVYEILLRALTPIQGNASDLQLPVPLQDTSNTIEIGNVVVIKGLKDRADMNGKQAVVMERIQSNKGAFHFELLLTGSTDQERVCCKPENLEKEQS
jgi:hypothetical protein